MYTDLTKHNIENKRDNFNRVIFEFAVSRPYTPIILLALLCTLTAKLFYAIHCSLIYQYPDWILSDVAFLLGMEVMLAFVCFLRPKAWIIRIATFLAGAICLWSFLNAGWLIRTGTQILPRVLLPVMRHPLSAFRMVGINLYKMPVTAFFLLLPFTIIISFFFFVLAEPKPPNYKRKRFFIRFNASIIICLAAIAVRPVFVRSKSPQPLSLEMQYNAQLKAVTSLFSREYKPPPDPTRRVPFYDQIKVVQGPHLRKDNIIVIVLEGVQYEQTSLSGNTGDLTPYLSSLAARGATFTNLRSILTHTTKALFTLLTGRFASASQDIVEAVPIDKAYSSLPTILRGQLGYRTAFFQSAAGDFECRPGLVHNLGFDKFWAREDLNDPNQFLGYLGCDEFALIKPITKWVQSDSKPFFITVMCSVTHDPYEVPKWYGQQPKEDIERYRQTISYTDKFLSSLEAELSSLGIMDNTVFCVVGDHGEGFNEHGRSGHERIAFDEALHIPFCIKAPSIEPGTVISSPASSIDLAPTLLGLLGFQTEKAGFDGINLLGTIQEERKIYFSGWMYESQAGFMQGSLKYIFDPMHKITCFYDLEKDPYEQVRFDVPEEQKQAVADEIETWRENTIFQFNQEYKGKKIIYDKWLCRWSNRDASAKYISIQEAKEFRKRIK